MRCRILAPLGVVAVLALGAPPAAAHPPVMTTEFSIIGKVLVYRNGVEQDYWTMTGWGLPNAFKGVPAAVDLAERYQFWATTGNVISIVGNGVVAWSVWDQLRQIKNDLPGSDRPVSYWGLRAGLLVSIGGGALAQASKRLIFQAVNVYNRELEREPDLVPEIQGQLTDTGAPQMEFLLTYRL